VDDARPLLPLFPLGLVLVPGLVLPLHVFEPRYRLLVSTLLELPEEERTFGVVAIRDGHEVGADAIRSLHAVGTTAELREATQLDDGRFDIVTTGVRRFRVLEIDDELPYRRARVDYIDEIEGDSASMLAPQVARTFGEYRAALSDSGALDSDLVTELPDDAGVLSYLVAAAVIVELSERQRLLEQPTTEERLRAEISLLRRETALLKVLPSIPAVDLSRMPSDLN
jgi:uncharacterized protein